MSLAKSGKPPPTPPPPPPPPPPHTPLMQVRSPPGGNYKSQENPAQLAEEGGKVGHSSACSRAASATGLFGAAACWLTLPPPGCGLLPHPMGQPSQADMIAAAVKRASARLMRWRHVTRYLPSSWPLELRSALARPASRRRFRSSSGPCRPVSSKPRPVTATPLLADPYLVALPCSPL